MAKGGQKKGGVVYEEDRGYDRREKGEFNAC